MSNNWVDFWKEKNAFDDAMDMSYSYFLSKIDQYLHPTPSSVVLDLGSGPGNLEDVWQKKVKELHAVDVSERYNEMVRQKHKQHQNVFVYDLPGDDYLNLSMLHGKQFNIMIVMSVLQYYKNKEEVKQLIKQLKTLAAPSASLLLADLMVKTSFIKEVAQVLKDAYKQGKFFRTLLLFFKLRFSKYYKVKKEAGFLILSEEDWKAIIDELQLQAKFIEEPITLQKMRKNLLITFA